MNINAEWEPNQADAEPEAHELDAAAIAKGYARRVVAEGGDYTLDLLIKPDADLDGTFTAWDTDESEFLRVNGWLFTFDFS